MNLEHVRRTRINPELAHQRHTLLAPRLPLLPRVPYLTDPDVPIGPHERDVIVATVRQVITEGLAGGEVVVTDGQLLLAEGSKVSVRQPKAGS